MSYIQITDKILKIIPSDIDQFYYLTSISISANPQFSYDINPLEFNNQPLVIPRELKNLINISSLYLISCNLETIPDCVFNLVNLKILCVEDNNVAKISKKISKLVKLRKLFLSRNNIKILPKEINNIASLAIIRVDSYVTVDHNERLEIVRCNQY